MHFPDIFFMISAPPKKKTEKTSESVEKKPNRQTHLIFSPPCRRPLGFYYRFWENPENSPNRNPRKKNRIVFSDQKPPKTPTKPPKKRSGLEGPNVWLTEFQANYPKLTSIINDLRWFAFVYFLEIRSIRLKDTPPYSNQPPKSTNHLSRPISFFEMQNPMT